MNGIRTVTFWCRNDRSTNCATVTSHAVRAFVAWGKKPNGQKEELNSCLGF